MIKKIIDAIALGGNMFGAILVAVSGTNPGLAIIGYLVFMAGCGASIYLLKHSNASKSLLFISWYFMAANVVGIAMRLPMVL